MTLNSTSKLKVHVERLPTLELSYTSVVPAGVATNVMTSQSMVLSGGGASVSDITPKKLDRLFFTFSVVSEEPSTWNTQV